MALRCRVGDADACGSDRCQARLHKGPGSYRGRRGCCPISGPQTSRTGSSHSTTSPRSKPTQTSRNALLQWTTSCSSKAAEASTRRPRVDLDASIEPCMYQNSTLRARVRDPDRLQPRFLACALCLASSPPLPRVDGADERRASRPRGSPQYPRPGAAASGAAWHRAELDTARILASARSKGGDLSGAEPRSSRP